MTISATKFQAMLRAGGVSRGTGKRELKKHLSAHLGKGFCPARRSVDMLAEGHCKVYSGSFEFTYDGKDVQWQMKNIPGGLGDKMEDWVERQHQWGMRQRRRFRNVQDPLVRALAREKATSCNTHPDVLAQVDTTDTGNKQKLSEIKADVILTRRKLQRDVGRWAEVLFRDGEVDSDSQNADRMEY